MATEQTVKVLKDLCGKAIATPIESLVRNPDWGKINFDAATADLTRIFWTLSLLNELPIEVVPDDPVNQMINAARTCENIIKGIRTFTIEGNQNPSETRNSLVSQVKTSADALTSVTATWIPFLAYQRGDVQRNIESLSGAVTAAKRLLDDAQGAVTSKKDEIDDIVRAAREASASAGVAHFAADFSDEATVLEGQATTWLWWTAGLAVFTVIVSVAMAFVDLPDPVANGKLLQYFSSKFVTLAIFITATVWCGRLYKAAKHQAATNKHRANALKTFQAFIKAGSDDQTRDAVLLETTKSIFAPGITGYLDGKDGGADGTLKVMEFVKSAAKLGDTKP